MASHCTWPEMTIPRPRCNLYLLSLPKSQTPWPLCYWTPATLCICFSNTQLIYISRLNQSEISSSWKDFRTALGMPGSFLITTSQHRSRLWQPQSCSTASKQTLLDTSLLLFASRHYLNQLICIFPYCLTPFLEKALIILEIYFTYFAPSSHPECKFYESWDHLYM